MWVFGRRQVGRLVLGLLGAVLVAATISSLSGHDESFGHAVVERLIALRRFDFGESAVSQSSAWLELSRRLPATIELVGFGAVIAFVIGAPVGILLSAGRIVRAAAPLIQLIAAAPVFCAGLGLLWVSQRALHWTGSPRALSVLAALGSGNIAELAAALRAIALPALTVGAAGAASVQLALRHSVSRAVVEPYRRSLRAMGLGRFEIDRLYLLPQVAAGVLRSQGEIVSSLLAAAAVAEWVFDWPGAAELFLKSVALRDWTVVGLIILVFAATTMLAEFVGAVAGHVLGLAEIER